MAIVKSVSQFGCVFQDSDALDSQGTKECRRNPMQKVHATQFKEFDSQSPRYVTRVSGTTKDHRLEKTQVKRRHQRGPYATKFEDRSHEETERQERCAQSKAWNLAKHISCKVSSPWCLSNRARGERVCS